VAGEKEVWLGTNCQMQNRHVIACQCTTAIFLEPTLYQQPKADIDLTRRSEICISILKVTLNF
jgi:hypothetical protein